MDKLKDICDLNEKLIDLTKSKFGMGLEQVDTKEAGDVIDMIKDLAEAEEKMVKACYYKTVIEAMNHPDAYGYRHRGADGRYKSGYVSEPMMRNYTGATLAMDGYTPDHMMNDMRERFGYNHPPMPERPNHFDNWRNSRRHYQETRSKSDKEEMDMHAKAHLNEAMMTLKEVMSNSDPELQRKMKNDLTNLINDIQ